MFGVLLFLGIGIVFIILVSSVGIKKIANMSNKKFIVIIVGVWTFVAISISLFIKFVPY